MLSAGLYLVATPIGNLEDLTPRALSVLENVSRVYAEDTRHTQKLLNHFSLKVDLRSLHQHNEMSRFPEISDLVADGSAVALVTDAGTPGVSDPGSAIVDSLLKANLPVIPIPGASSLSTALSVSGFDHGDVGTLWKGFLPQKPKARRTVLAELARFAGVVVFLESPHRIQACAEDLAELLDDRELVVCRELTKRFETIYRTTCKEFPALSEDAARGELTLVLGPSGSSEAEASDEHREALAALDALLQAGWSAKDASKAASTIFKVSKKLLYNVAIGK